MVQIDETTETNDADLNDFIDKQWEHFRELLEAALELESWLEPCDGLCLRCGTAWPRGRLSGDGVCPWCVREEVCRIMRLKS